jgi:RNA polymerase subunit RPABC4/transcription elongation factor Spt4
VHATSCSNCGASVDEDASERCPECNAPLKVVCPSCGALVPEDEEECPTCGGSLAHASQPG